MRSYMEIFGNCNVRNRMSSLKIMEEASITLLNVRGYLSRSSGCNVVLCKIIYVVVYMELRWVREKSDGQFMALYQLKILRCGYLGEGL
jgi:hypothetical protein